ncbi:hypothetical protein E1B28_007192 [Marasmius oreades]|uniref:Uncharacterized protein n=1 Tax=Marasmius oreades TaxID=181124 RepID=A0A9P7S1R4_9AGAR|nr:uncharacterized protein E1B28_007192 [Marasmius oreades]KAG7093518.1 hypothetical protein E1B28_007192 [Marasmius oreades]
MVIDEIQTKEYVKGYGIDCDKVKAAIETTDDSDGRIDAVMEWILLRVDRDIHSLCIGRAIDGEPQSFHVIAFGEEAFHTDPEALRKKDILAPDYLKFLVEPFFIGPDVYEVVD